MQYSKTTIFDELHKLFSSGDLPKLEKKCELILEEYPNHEDALTFQAICLKHHKMDKEALEILNQTLEKNQDNLYALIHRSHLFLLHANYKKAKQDLEYLKEMFIQEKVPEKWKREHVEYVSERAKFIFKAIKEQEDVRAESEFKKLEKEKEKSIYKIFEGYDMKKLVKTLNGFAENLLDRDLNENENVDHAKSRLRSRTLKSKTKESLEQVDNEEKIENYKITLAKCLSHLNFTIDDIIERKISLNDSNVQGILSYIPLIWYLSLIHI